MLSPMFIVWNFLPHFFFLVRLHKDDFYRLLFPILLNSISFLVCGTLGLPRNYFKLPKFLPFSFPKTRPESSLHTHVW